MIRRTKTGEVDQRSLNNKGNLRKSYRAIDLRYDRFAIEFLRDLNGTQAAIRAGYAPNNATEQATLLLKNPKVIKLLQDKQAALAAKHDVTLDKIIAELAKIGFANIEDYTRLVGENRVIDLSNTSRDQLAAVAEITIDEYVEGHGDNARDVKRTKIKMHDKKGALVDLGRHLGLFDGHEPPAPGAVYNIDARSITVNATPEEASRTYQRLVSGRG